MLTPTNLQKWLEAYDISSAFDVMYIITLKDGTELRLNNMDIEMGSIRLNDSITEISEINIGSTNASVLTFTLLNFSGNYTGFNFYDATVLVKYYGQAPGYGQELSGNRYIVTSQDTQGNRITLEATASIGTDAYNEETITGQTGGGNSAYAEIATTWGGSVTDFPNMDFIIPEVTFPHPISKRDFIGYIAEMCGCYVRETTNRWLGVYPFATVDFTDSLDGGNFTYTTADDADGGLFDGALGANLLPYIGDNTSEIVDGITFTYQPTDVNVVGTASADIDNPFMTGFYLHPGMYRLYGDKPEYKIKLTQDGTEIPVTGELFTVTDYLKPIVPSIVIENGTQVNKFTQPMITTADIDLDDFVQYIHGWTGGDAYDGGLFAFWDTSRTIYTASDAYELKKVMQAEVGERIFVTGVSVSGDGFDTVTVGTDDYLIEIKDNPFIQTQATANAVAQQVYNTAKGVSFVPFNVSWSADPIVEPGDVVKFEDINGNETVTLCTGIDYSLGNISTIGVESYTRR